MKAALLSLCLLLLCPLLAQAQDQTEPVQPDKPATKTQTDTTTNLNDGVHQPVMKTNAHLGYQIYLVSEKLQVPDSPLKEITAGGVVYHAPRIGGMYRLGASAGSLANSFVFGDYTFLSQPVNDERIQEDYTRSTHFVDAGLGYFFKIVEDRVEIAPYLGMSAQFNLNDRNPAPENTSNNVYYHANQSRVGFGLGSILAVRFDDTLPFPLFLFVNAGVFPLTPVFDDAADTSFPDNLTVLHLTGSFYGRFLPYLGGELGIRQQFHFGGSPSSSFNGSWTEFFAMVRFEPEILFTE